MCSKRFLTIHLLKKHEEIQNKKVDYECLKCGKFFVDDNELKLHIETHNSNKDCVNDLISGPENVTKDTKPNIKKRKTNLEKLIIKKK